MLIGFIYGLRGYECVSDFCLIPYPQRMFSAINLIANIMNSGASVLHQMPSRIRQKSDEKGNE